MKLSNAQNKALAQMLDNEWRTHRKRNDSQFRNTRQLPCGTKSTLGSLINKGLIYITMGGDYRYQTCGRQMAIDMLHESAEHEMNDAFKYRDMEVKRTATALKIKQAIMQAHGLYNWEVEVIANYRLRDMSLRYSIDLAQIRVGRPLSDLVRIGWTHDQYTVDTTGTSLTAHSAKRMGELMLIASQIIESGILDA